MNTTTIVILAVVALLIAGGVAVYLQNRRSHELRVKYGKEYGNAIEQTGDRHKAEAELRQREKRIQKLDLRALSPREQTEFSDRWRQVQAEFVDDPGAAVAHADDLLAEVMGARGYPVTDFDQRAADLSVHHPKLVGDYRMAHDVAQSHSRGEAGTEDLRKALIHYRALFEDLLAPTPQDRRAEESRSFMPEETPDERAAHDRTERDVDRALDDRAARERRRAEDGDGRAPHV